MQIPLMFLLCVLTLNQNTSFAMAKPTVSKSTKTVGLAQKPLVNLLKQNNSRQLLTQAMYEAFNIVSVETYRKKLLRTGAISSVARCVNNADKALGAELSTAIDTASFFSSLYRKNELNNCAKNGYYDYFPVPRTEDLGKKTTLDVLTRYIKNYKNVVNAIAASKTISLQVSRFADTKRYYFEFYLSNNPQPGIMESM